MVLTVLKSKIHRAVVTETNLEYVGSITIDEELMEAAEIYPYEQVHVWNITNGSRLITYALKGERGSGVICINGAGAHHNRVGDRVIIAAFGQVEKEKIFSFSPKIVLVNAENKIETILEN